MVASKLLQMLLIMWKMITRISGRKLMEDG